ncbi:MAG: ROK family protein [Anaerolineaceae bacterium]|nr:ROK family protein [Anaerolineaceae bacterium]
MYATSGGQRCQAPQEGRLRIIAVDLGGTRIRAACLDENLNILQRRETLTRPAEGQVAVLGRIEDLVTAVWPGETEVLGIGVSSPGPLDPYRGIVLAPPNLPDWHQVPLADLLAGRFAVPVRLGKDANVALLAEAAHGAAQGCRHAIYLTLSTGIGAGILCDGRLLLGHGGLATEVGSMMLLVNGVARRLEMEAAGPALARQARQRLAAGEVSLLRAMCDGDLREVDAAMVGAAAQQGDPLALALVRRAGRLIGLGLTSLLHLFNPEVVVIGGGLSLIGAPLLEPMRDTVRREVIYEGYTRSLRIEAAALGADVSLVGAAALLRSDGGRELEN